MSEYFSPSRNSRTELIPPNARPENGKIVKYSHSESPKTPRDLPPIPGKRYFTIGEVSELCDVKQHVLRYWEQEFTQLRPVKRRGNRRYYQREDVIMVRRIRALLYEQGFTISGARQRLGINNENLNPEIPASEEKILVRQMRLELEELLEILESS